MIDFHTHIFPEQIAEKTIRHLEEIFHDSARANGMKSGLLASMEEAGVDQAIILPVATKVSQFDSINRFALEFRGEKLLSFAGIHPQTEDYKEKLRWIKEQGFLGIKLHPDYQDTYINDIRCKRLISYASEMDLIVSIHAGVDPLSPHDVHCTPKMAAEMIDEVRPTKLILAHMGGHAMYDETEQYLVGKNVYFDTAVILDRIKEEQFLRMVKNHGVDRILFGTDCPWASQKLFVDILKQMPLTEEEKAKIFQKNAEKLLKNS